MVPFNLENLHVRYVMLKSCTTALGGSIRIVDELATAADPQNKEQYSRVDVPMALIRAFVKTYNMSQYLKPVPVAITTYEDHVVAIERHPLGSLGEMESLYNTGLFEDGPQHWKSQSEKNIHGVFTSLVNEHVGDWYIDGKFIYNYDDHLELEIQKGEWLSSDGKFRTISVNAIKLANIGNSASLSVELRACLAFVSAQGKYALTPPVWKTLKVGDKQLSSVDQPDRGDLGGVIKNYRFDEIDECLAVNLNFVLRAGKELSGIFGPEIMEPLGLPKLMIQLQTVNLPSIATSVKSTFDTGIRFTHACAWLIGLVERTNTFESYVALRSLLKYLTQKGIFRKNMFRPEHVFKKGFTLDMVPLKSKEEALISAETPTIDEWIQQRRGRNASTAVLGNAVTGMYDDADEF